VVWVVVGGVWVVVGGVWVKPPPWPDPCLSNLGPGCKFEYADSPICEAYYSREAYMYKGGIFCYIRSI
jgi:hypothetical protein